jgi:hypothetical protein
MSQASTVDTIGEAEDPLDRADFDAVAYINQQFPTESSLKRLDPFVSRVNSNIAHLDDEISRAVHTQAEVRSFIGLCCLSEFSSVCSGDYFPLPPTFLEPMPHTPPRVLLHRSIVPPFLFSTTQAGERAAKDITEAKAAIHDLHTKIKDIKGKAEQSVLMVQEICKDIRQLVSGGVLT